MFVMGRQFEKDIAPAAVSGDWFYGKVRGEVIL
jgi:hypothetical protein